MSGLAKEKKLNIKGTNIAKALNLDSVKDKLAKKRAGASKDKKTAPSKSEKAAPKKAAAKPKKEETKPEAEAPVEEAPKVRARSKSVFAEEKSEEQEPAGIPEEKEESAEAPADEKESPLKKEGAAAEETEKKPVIEEKQKEEAEKPLPNPAEKEAKPVKLGPTGKHIKDILPPKPQKSGGTKQPPAAEKPKAAGEDESGKYKKKGFKGGKLKEFRDFKPTRQGDGRGFDARDRKGLRAGEDEHRWRKKRHKGSKIKSEENVVRPSELKVRIPITVKELAAAMKLKASQLVEKLFIQGIVKTLNDLLDDETIIQLIGHEFGCEITIDTSEAERIRITDKTIKEEIAESESNNLKLRAPVVTFMGHVDHGKTSLIDTIRKSDIAAGEAGAITQHIGAFKCHTKFGEITILDTPGHEAFSAMRARGADVTDIVVLVVAGDEGFRQQTDEAMQHAKAAGVTIVVAINKSDKPGYDADNVYRQLSEKELLPEDWGGQTICVKCSAATGEGLDALIEMLALQAEVLELKADSSHRARGIVLESEMHKGMGAVATVLVLNGTLKHGDPLVFDHYWGRVKTMQDEHGKSLQEAGPSTPVEITGLSDLPEAGQEFIVVKTEKEAREIAEVRELEARQKELQKRRSITLESLLQDAEKANKKILNVILRADVQGSLEALKSAVAGIDSDKVEVNIIFTGVGEISESDVQLAAASNAVIVGFHTQIESHAESLLKQYGVRAHLHDIIYHAIDDVKGLMAGTLDKVAQEIERAKVEVRAIFRSSQLGVIAGCMVIEGTVERNHHARLLRDGEVIWKGPITSLKRHTEDVKEVKKDFECGILIDTNDIKEGDIIETYEITYIEQML